MYLIACRGKTYPAAKKSKAASAAAPWCAFNLLPIYLAAAGFKVPPPPPPPFFCAARRRSLQDLKRRKGLARDTHPASSSWWRSSSEYLPPTSGTSSFTFLLLSSCPAAAAGVSLLQPVCRQQCFSEPAAEKKRNSRYPAPRPPHPGQRKQQVLPSKSSPEYSLCAC